MDDRPVGVRPVAFVLGKPPAARRSVSEVIDRIRAAGYRVAPHLPHDAAEPVPAWLFDAQLVVQRGLNHGAMAAMERLEAARCSLLQPDPRHPGRP